MNPFDVSNMVTCPVFCEQGHRYDLKQSRHSCPVCDEIAQLQSDKEMLDWLEAKRATCRWDLRLHYVVSLPGYLLDGLPAQCDGDSIRDAIRAAMNEGK